MKYFPFLIIVSLCYSCSTTKEGVIQIDTNPLKNISRQVEKREGYCSPLNEIMNNKCAEKKKKSK